MDATLFIQLITVIITVVDKTDFNENRLRFRISVAENLFNKLEFRPFYCERNLPNHRPLLDCDCDSFSISVRRVWMRFSLRAEQWAHIINFILLSMFLFDA